MADTTKKSKPKLAKQSTDIKLKDIAKRAKKMYEQESYEFEDGTTLTFFVEFPKSLIEDMYEELQKHLITITEKNIELNDKDTLYFLYTMTIKHFTHLKKEMPDEVLGEGKNPGLLDYMKHFADTGLMKTIIDDVFLASEIHKVLSKLTDLTSIDQIIRDLEVQTKDKVKNMKLKNKDIFDQFREKTETEDKSLN